LTAIQIDEAEFEARPTRLARLLDEIRGQDAFRWAPVALVLGIWIYFALPVEPSRVVCAVFGIAAHWRRRCSPALSSPKSAPSG
jgi:hypothetical protein